MGLFTLSSLSTLGFGSKAGCNKSMCASVKIAFLINSLVLHDILDGASSLLLLHLFFLNYIFHIKLFAFPYIMSSFFISRVQPKSYVLYFSCTPDLNPKYHRAGYHFLISTSYKDISSQWSPASTLTKTSPYFCRLPSSLSAGTTPMFMFPWFPKSFYVYAPFASIKFRLPYG